MSDVGYIALFVALVIALYGVFASLLGGRRNMPEMVASGRNAIYVVSFLVLTASLLLWRALLTDQFNLEYVATHTERALPLAYKFSAFWGGQEGSLTLWTLLLCAFAVAATWFFRNQQSSLKPYVQAVLLVNLVFFLLVVLLAANPFTRIWQTTGGQVVTAVFQPAGARPLVPNDGQGLNPQLQNYWMVVHPIALYLGFIGMTVPFAFAVGALATGQLGNTWIKIIRRWTLIPWLFLSAGIILGSQWAYVELGWGGYWAWDPVENASFLPWLTATAFLHSIMIQERRGMLKVWNVVLIWLTWELMLVGTFLTRSGVIQSVHSFALSPIGPMFAAFIVLSMIGFLALLIWRLPLLQSENQLDSVVSRETSFLTQNVIFLLIMFATLLGTLFAPISEWVTGNKISLSAPYFERVNGPLFLVLLILMGAAPLLAWRRSGSTTLRRNFAIPVASALVAVPVALVVGDRSLPSMLGFAVVAFIVAGIIQEYVRGVNARHQATGEPVPLALVNLVKRNGRRYGGYIVHLGVIMVALAIIGHQFFQTEGQANLAPGQSLQLGRYTLTYRGMDFKEGPNFGEAVATIDLSQGGRPAGQILPKKLIYNKYQDQPMTEVGLRVTPADDVYVVLAGFENNGQTASFKAYVNPLMAWMWGGGLVIMLGVLVAVWPRAATVAAEARVRVPAGAQPVS